MFHELPSASIDAYKYSFFPAAIWTWNSLPADVFLCLHQDVQVWIDGHDTDTAVDLETSSFVTQLALVFISLWFTHAPQPRTTILKWEVLPSIGRQIRMLQLYMI